MAKSVLTQMIHSYMQPHDKSNTFIIITIKNITWGMSNKFQDTIFGNNKNFCVPKGRITIASFNDCRRKEKVFEEVASNFKTGSVINIFLNYMHGFLRY